MAEATWEAVAPRLRPRIPLATYRVQLNPELTFEALRVEVDYLAALGISDVYASPFFKSRPGSMHGYDLVDHNALNPAIGSEDDFERLTDALAARGLGLLLDFVPNHMGIGPFNTWWMDVLENGPSSIYAPFFDIDWSPVKAELRTKVLLPVLGDHYGRVLEGGEIRIRFESGAFFLSLYGSFDLPVNPRTYPMVLQPMLPDLEEALGTEHDTVLELQSIITNLINLPPRSETKRSKVIERRREKEILKRRLAELCAASRPAEVALARSVERMNGIKGEPRTFDAMDRLLEEQAYRLSFWRVAAEEINYRRFFDINDLAAIRMESPVVFAEAHRLLFKLLGRGRVTGLRIDHPDGLWDPTQYFESLQRGYFLALCREHSPSARTTMPPTNSAHVVDQHEQVLLARFDAARAAGEVARRPLYVVGEKILTRGERVPEDWAVHGTSGYEFATLVGGIFVDPSSEQAMTTLYQRFIGQASADFESLVYQQKKVILRVSLASELNVLAHALEQLSEKSRHSRDFTLGALKDALREVIACFPVYRTYIGARTTTLTEHDRVAVGRAIRLARRRNPSTDVSVFAFLRSVFMLELPDTVAEEDRELYREFVMKCQQLTGPVMAKGLEDTAFYIYNRLISLNEVGGEPERYGRAVADFHAANAERQRTWPHSLLTTSTHDTKRSGDVRARITVLSELPYEWEAALAGAGQAAARFKADLEGQLAPDANEEYLFYQAALGIWPDDDAFEPARIERLVAYMRKATKEAKVHTSWINADPDYDAAVESFVRQVLAPDAGVTERLAPLARKLAFHGRWAALSQLLLKLCSPGVPDIYQGNEIWDDSLVDPDNRRRVDFAHRRALLAGIEARRGEGARLAMDLVERAADGRIKMFVTSTTLDFRRRNAVLFGDEGAYAPVETRGARAEHLIAFTRRAGDHEVVVVAPRLTAALAGGRLHPPLGEVWEDTVLPLGHGRWVDVFTGEAHGSRGDRLEAARVLAHFPLALLERRRS